MSKDNLNSMMNKRFILFTFAHGCQMINAFVTTFQQALWQIRTASVRPNHTVISQQITLPASTRLYYLNAAGMWSLGTETDIEQGASVINAAVTECDVGILESKITKLSMIVYIVSMCIALPVALAPTAFLRHSKVVSKTDEEIMSLRTGQRCARTLLNMMPFAKLNVISSEPDSVPEPSIWCINHTSMLDVFLLLAADEDIRGRNRRPLKCIYWKGLDDNPVTKLLFRMSGFIAVQMEATGSGNPNNYDRSSFKSLLKETKKAFDDGFDVLIFPEGQLNPWPDKGLLEVFPGAFKLAKMSRRPMRFVAMHGAHRLWHPHDDIGILDAAVTGREVRIRAYPEKWNFASDGDFVETFYSIVGHFGTTSEDLPESEMEQLLQKYDQIKEEGQQAF